MILMQTFKIRGHKPALLTKISICLLLVFFLLSRLHASELTLTGKASMGGESLNFTMTLSASAQFANKISGYQSMNTGFDGQSFWRVENGAGPFEIDFSEREIWIIVHWMLSGYWLDDKAPITWSRDPETGNAIFGLNDGRLKLLTTSSYEQLKSDQLKSRQDAQYAYKLPGLLRVVNLPQELTVSFIGVQQLLGKSLPEQIVINGIGEVESFDIQTANAGSNSDRSSNDFQKPAAQIANVSFDDSISSDVEIKQAKTGHIFVKPLINGEPVGWFLFDSGAGGTMMSQQLVEKFGLKRVAKTVTGGIGGSIGFSDLYKGGELTLGPLTVSDLNYKVYDPEHSMASKILGEPVVGVLGWDILTRSVVEVDMLKAKMAIYNPESYRIPEHRRERLFLHWKVPYVKARFSPDHSGIFMLDTGAGKGGVFFTNFTVETLGLLKDQKGQESTVRGAAGKVSIVRGQIDWFQVGGHETTNAPAIFSTGEDYEADIFSTGFLGGAVITPFKVVFDYQRNEVGFIKR
jgi:predicted aspartyl protease